MDGDARPYSPADARLTAILDSLLLGAVIIDPARHRLRQCRGGRDNQQPRGRHARQSLPPIYLPRSLQDTAKNRISFALKSRSIIMAY